MFQTPWVYGLWILHDDGFHRRFHVKAPMYDHGRDHPQTFEVSDTLAFVFLRLYFSTIVMQMTT